MRNSFLSLSTLICYKALQYFIHEFMGNCDSLLVLFAESLQECIAGKLLKTSIILLFPEFLFTPQIFMGNDKGSDWGAWIYNRKK